MGLPVKLCERVECGIGNQYDIATASTVSAARTAPRHKRLSYERDNTVAAVASPDFYYCRIEHVENRVKSLLLIVNRVISRQC